MGGGVFLGKRKRGRNAMLTERSNKERLKKGQSRGGEDQGWEAGLNGQHKADTWRLVREREDP